MATEYGSKSVAAAVECMNGVQRTASNPPAVWRTDGVPLITISRMGIFVQEVDEGRPCLDCQDKCSGFVPHEWRNICQTCKCLRESHDVYHEDFVNIRERLGWEEPKEARLQADKELTLQLGYSWVPPGLSADKVEEYMEQLDNNKIPKLAGVGDKHRALQLMVQLPKQDLAEEFCRQLREPTQRRAFDDFRDMRDATAMAVAHVCESLPADATCYHCTGEIERGELVVLAERMREDVCWHPACFICATCDELLVDLVYCHTGGSIYCERHYAQLIKPRCVACDELRGFSQPPSVAPHRRGSVAHDWSEASVQKPPSHPKCLHTPQDQLLQPNGLANLAAETIKEKDEKKSLIFSGEYTKAMDQDWHSGHFCCWNCDLSLTGHRYILREEHPYCIKCYENLFANTCEECKTPIGTDSKDLSYKDKHWHENCFKCCDCQGSLVDQPFAAKDEKLYCADCHDNNFAARCDGCEKIFRAGMKKYEYKGKQWHEECFCCKVCQQPIGNKSFIPRDQEVVCVPCYEDQYAQRCMKCNGVINKGGITYKATPWHRDCFTCTNCEKILAGEKFTSREDKPYCADCFGDLFAKKCCKCVKAITGLGGTKFISFEDRHWHSDCFVCYKCSNSLVGRGFLTDGEDILCPDCGRA